MEGYRCDDNPDFQKGMMKVLRLEKPKMKCMCRGLWRCSGQGVYVYADNPELAWRRWFNKQMYENPCKYWLTLPMEENPRLSRPWWKFWIRNATPTTDLKG